MRKYKKQIEIDNYRISGEIESMAWKKTGFKDADDLRDAVRNLSVEERVEMLTEIFIDELASMHLEKKHRFIESLGGTPAVTEKELKDYAEATFKNTDDIEWKIDIRGDHYISPSYLAPMDYREENRKSLRRKKWKDWFLTERKR